MRSATTRRTLLTAALLGTVAHAERPAPRGAPELFPPVEGRPLTPGAAYLERLPPAARERLKKDGHVILDQKTAGSGPSLLKAVVRFTRPRSEVWALITQPAQQQTFLPNVTESKVVGERAAEGEVNDYVVSFIFTFKYRTQHWFYPEQDRMEWNLDPSGGDGLAEQLGYWQLYELDEKTTIAEYGTRIVARGAILNFFRSLGERGAIAEALTAFRKHVDTATP